MGHSLRKNLWLILQIFILVQFSQNCAKRKFNDPGQLELRESSASTPTEYVYFDVPFWSERGKTQLPKLRFERTYTKENVQ